MNITNAFKTLGRALAKFIGAIFYLFSACTLVLFIAFCLRGIMRWCGANDRTIEISLYVFAGFVAIYIIGKIYYFIYTWVNKRKKAKEEALIDELNKDHYDERTATTPESTTTLLMPTKKPSIFNRFIPKKKLPPVEPQKAGNSHW